MLRALSTRVGLRGYERLSDEPIIDHLEGELKRSKSVPTGLFGSSRKPKAEFIFTDSTHMKNPKIVKKSHPLFSLFQGRRKKRATALPEFARYLEYLKEGGIWDLKSNEPVMYYK